MWNLTRSESRLANLDALRALAATWVFLFHMSEGGHLPALRASLPDWLYWIVFDAGHLGVPIFFVLSGTVMACATASVHLNAHNTRQLMLRRLARLTPPYYVAIAVSVAMLLVKHAQGAPLPAYLSSLNVAAHALYLQPMLSLPSILPIFWTLSIEVQFYAAFALMTLISDSAAKSVSPFSREVFALVVAVVALLWPLGAISSIGWDGGFIGFWYSFMVGVACGQLSLGAPIARYAAPVLSMVVAAIGLTRGDAFCVTVGATGLFICGTVLSPLLDHVFALTWLRRVGLISYSIYLFHSPATGLSMRVMKPYLPQGALAEIGALVGALMATLTAATVSYVLVERRAIALSKRIRYANS